MINNNDFIVIPGTEIRLYENDIVELSSYPGHQFIIEQSEYQYKGQTIFGWHFRSLIDNLMLPIDVSTINKEIISY